MKCAKLIEPGKIIITETEKPRPKDDEVLIRVKYCGICGSDIHAYHGLHPFIKPPIILGHEFAGVIEEVGSKVKNLRKGQRVTVEPLITCGKCSNCKMGHYNRCIKMKVIGCQTNGALAEYVAVPANRVYELPDSISFKHGALVEPLAVAIHAVRRANFVGGSRVVVIGAGTIGLLTAAVAKLFGALEVIISDLYDAKLKIAKELGIDHTVNVKRENFVEVVKEIYSEEGADIVFECVGSNKVTINQAIEVVKKGGRIVVVGVFKEPIPVNVGYIQDREIELVGTAVYTFKDFVSAIELLKRELIDLDLLISKVFSLEEVPKAFEYIDEHRDTVIKVLIKVS